MSDKSALTAADVLETARELFSHYGWGPADRLARARIEAMRDLALSALAQPDAQAQQPVAQAFHWPAGAQPVQTVTLGGDVVIHDDIEDAPLLTIRGHNGVSAEAFVAHLEQRLAPQAQTRREVVEECAKVCDGLASFAFKRGLMATGQHHEECAAALRALAQAIQAEQGKETK